jgi:hypothetical protein
MKYRIVHTLQKYVLNPPIKLALLVELPLPGYALLETKGRKTGKSRTPVGVLHQELMPGFVPLTFHQSAEARLLRLPMRFPCRSRARHVAMTRAPA